LGTIANWPFGGGVCAEANEASRTAASGTKLGANRRRATDIEPPTSAVADVARLGEGGRGSLTGV
jgi:hypothetical protein